MSMSKDRVRFFVRKSTYNEDPIKFHDLMFRSFGLTNREVNAFIKSFAMDSTVGLEGAWVVCRPSQFARFVIHRSSLGFQNGVRDLNAVLFYPDKAGVFDFSECKASHPHG